MIRNIIIDDAAIYQKRDENGCVCVRKFMFDNYTFQLA